MVALATAFIALSPQLNKGYFVKAGEEAGQAAGNATGASMSKGFSKKTEGMFKNFKGSLIGAANVLGPLALAGVVAKIGQIGIAYENDMNIFQVVTGATGRQMEVVAKKARELGADITLPGVSAAGATEAMTELAKAGFDVQQSMDAAKATLQLARIAEISEGEAAVVAANAVNAFGIKAAETVQVVDELAAAANSSSVDIHDVDLAFRQASATFSGFQGPAVGSMEAITELNTAVAILGNNGIRGSDAGTSLKQMLLQLTGPTQRAKTVMEELAYIAAGANVSLEQQTQIIQGSKKVRDTALEQIKKQNKGLGELGDVAYRANGSMRSLPEIIDIVTKATKGMTEEQRNAAITQIFGADATRSVIALMKGGLPVYELMRQKVLRQGASADFAAAKNKGLAGSLDNVRSQLENAAIEIYNQVRGPLTKAFNNWAKSMVGIPEKIGAIGKFAHENAGLIKFLAQSLLTATGIIIGYRLAILGVIAATKGWLLIQAAFSFVQLLTQVRSLADLWALFGVNLGKVNPKIAEATTKLEAQGVAGAKAAAGMQRAAKETLKTAVALGALAGLGQIADQIDNSTYSVGKLTDALTEMSTTGKVTGELQDAFGKNLENLDNVGRVANSANEGFGKFIHSVADAIPIVGGAAYSLGNLGARLTTGTDFEKAKAQFADLDSALTNFATTTQDARKSSDLWNQVLLKSGLNTNQLAKLMPNAYKEIGDLNRAMDQSSIDTDKAANAQRGMKNATKTATGAVQSQKQSLKDLATQLQEMYDPAFAFIQAQIAFKKAQEDANKALKENGSKSKEARDANLTLASATLDLANKAADLGSKFKGKLTPEMIKLLKNAGVGKAQIALLSTQMKDAKKESDKLADGFNGAQKAAKKLSGNYYVNVYLNGLKKVKGSLKDMLIAQEALKKGISVSAATSAFNKQSTGLAAGGQVPGYSPSSTADNIPAMLTAGEFVQPVDTVKYYGPRLMEALRTRRVSKEQLAAAVASYAQGGTVLPYPMDVSKTWVPTREEALNAVGPPVPGHATYKWIEHVVKSIFPGISILSDFRPGARTLTGNVSYHALGRAVDFSPWVALAKYWNARYMKDTKELITPWRQYDIHNGRRYHYSEMIHDEHAGTGAFPGNAHVHIAMRKGGLVPGMPGVRLFDNGGYWPSGTLGLNMSGRTEYVNPHGGAPEVHFHFHAPVGDKRAAQMFVLDAYRELKKDGRIR